jgi:hypothetical protein
VIIRALDSNHDWKFGKGKNSYLRDLDALKQDTKTRILEWKYDCFFAQQNGIDWNNYLDIGTKDFLDLDIKRVILQTPGILKINDYESTILDRNVSASMYLETIYGSTYLNV